MSSRNFSSSPLLYLTRTDLLAEPDGDAERLLVQPRVQQLGDLQQRAERLPRLLCPVGYIKIVYKN